MEPVGLVVADASDHIAEVGEGFRAVQFAGAEQGVHEGGMARTSIAAAVEPCPSPLGKRPGESMAPTLRSPAPSPVGFRPTAWAPAPSSCVGRLPPVIAALKLFHSACLE